MGKRPFRNLTPDERRNLALAAVFAIYIAYVGVGLYYDFSQGTLVFIGKDYLVFWSAGYLANTQGYVRAYDLDALRQVQASWVPTPPDPSLIFLGLAAPYPVLLLLVFQFFAIFHPILGLFIWIIINISLLITYLRFLIKKTVQKVLPERFLWMVLGSSPVFWNLIMGHVNILFLVCVGEFLRWMIAKKPFRAGLWLGGLWLKPQMLILMVPALFLQRSWKALAGLVVAFLVIWGASVGIGGMEATHQMLNLWSDIASGLRTTGLHFMMNWRMVGICLSSFLGPEVGWGIALAGLALTVLAALYLWWRPVSPSAPQFGVALLGTMAATCAATWHSYPYMMVIIIPPLLYLLLRDCFPMALMDVWLFSMPALMLIGLFLELIGRFQPLPFISLDEAMGVLVAVAGLGVSLCLLAWAVYSIRGPRKPPIPAGRAEAD